MELIKKNIKSIIWGITLVSLIGCHNGPNRDIINNTPYEKNRPTRVNLNTQELKSINVAMSNLGYNGDQIAASMHNASMNASMQPGASAGAGLAGALIGGSIVQSATQRSAQNKKNEPIAVFLKTLESLNWQEIINASNLSAHYTISKQKEEKSAEPILTLTPNLQVTADYRSLRLTVTAKVTQKGKTTYTNFFHLQSPPLLKGDNLLNSINDTTHQEATEHLLQLINKVPYLVTQDMQSWPGKNLEKSTKIEFKNDSGTYFERGYLLEQTPENIIFKSLRGEIKNFPLQEPRQN